MTDTQRLNGFRVAQPDTDGAIGINSFVEFINGGFAVYNRNGTLAAPAISDSQFWLNAGVSSTLVNQSLTDPRIKYDPVSQRWFASEITTPSVNNSVLIAVSATSNPLGACQMIVQCSVTCRTLQKNYDFCARKDRAMMTNRPRIAIVDDNALVCQSIKKLVGSEGIDAEIFASGNELIEVLDERPGFRPGCVILDMGSKPARCEARGARGRFLQ